MGSKLVANNMKEPDSCRMAANIRRKVVSSLQPGSKKALARNKQAVNKSKKVVCSLADSCKTAARSRSAESNRLARSTSAASNKSALGTAAGNYKMGLDSYKMVARSCSLVVHNKPALSTSKTALGSTRVPDTVVGS